MLAGVFLGFRLLEGTKDLVPGGDGVRQTLHSGCESLKLIVSKVAVARPGRQNQVVVWKPHSFTIRRICDYTPSLLIHTGHLGHDDSRVALFAQNAADWRGNLARSQDGDGHLIE